MDARRNVQAMFEHYFNRLSIPSTYADMISNSFFAIMHGMVRDICQTQISAVEDNIDNLFHLIEKFYAAVPKIDLVSYTLCRNKLRGDAAHSPPSDFQKLEEDLKKQLDELEKSSNHLKKHH